MVSKFPVVVPKVDRTKVRWECPNCGKTNIVYGDFSKGDTLEKDYCVSCLQDVDVDWKNRIRGYPSV